MEPAAAMRILQENLPSDSKIFIDAGNCVGWSVHYLKVDYPQEIFTSLSMGPMGFAVGAVVGGKLGCPKSVCLCITGDGAFMMQGSEISTASRNRVGAIWLVLYDNDLSMVSQGQAHFFKNEGPQQEWSELFDLGKPDLVKYSQGLGATAYEATNPAELKKALLQAIEESGKGIPQVIIAPIDKTSVPPYYNRLYKP
jgi:acetolactate synthase-1/2/3 large subunit